MDDKTTATRDSTSVQLAQLPVCFLLQLYKLLSREDAKSLRLVSYRLCTLCSIADRLSCLKASALLTDAAPTLEHLPPISFLDFNARNSACSHQLLAALRQHGTRLEQSVRAVRLSGRDGLLAALQTLRLACPRIERLEIRCQHSYRGRHKECADLGRCLQELECAFPSLTELHLQRFPISSAQLVHLCDSLLGLRALSIRGLTHALTSESLAHLHRLSQLVSLSVDHFKLQDGCLPCGVQLRSLELSDATISARSFASLNTLACLQSLSIWGTGHRAALAFAPLTGLTALRRLHLELVLDARVLEGLQGCTALANLSAASARVLTDTAADDDDYGAGGGSDWGPVNGLSPPQLTSVTRLNLDEWSENCMPLAAWLPELRSLVLQDGAGMWSAVAGHEQLTALRVAAGGSLPPVAAVGSGKDAALSEAEAPASLGFAAVGGNVCYTGYLEQYHHVHNHNNHNNQHHSHMHRLGPRGSSSSDRSKTNSSRGDSSESSSDADSGAAGCITDGSCGDRPAPEADSLSHSLAEPQRNSSTVNRHDGTGTRPHVARRTGICGNGCTSGVEIRAGDTAPLPTIRSESGVKDTAEDGSCSRNSGGGSSCVKGVSCQPPPPHLASLRLGGCHDLSEQHYLSCAPMPALTACHLSGCGGLTTEALVRVLAAMPRLQELALEGAPYVTDQGLARLGAGSPDMWTCSAAVGDQGLEVGDEVQDRIDDAAAGAGLGMAVMPPGVTMACGPAVAAATKAAATATSVPVPPCTACAGVAEAVMPAPGGADTAAAGMPQAARPRGLCTAAAAAGAAAATVSCSSSCAALAAAAVTEEAGHTGAAEVAGAMAPNIIQDRRPEGTAAALRRLELTRLPCITARGVAAAAAYLPRLTELRVASCQAVCREACVWLPQQLGRPSLSVVCSHAAVYDDP